MDNTPTDNSNEASQDPRDVTAETPRTEQYPFGISEGASREPVAEAGALEPAQPVASPMPLSMPPFAPVVSAAAPSPFDPSSSGEAATHAVGPEGGGDAALAGGAAGMPPGGPPPYSPPYGDDWSPGGQYSSSSGAPAAGVPAVVMVPNQHRSRKVLVGAVAGVALLAGGLGAGLGVAFGNGSGSGGSSGSGTGSGGVALLPKSSETSVSGSSSVGAVASAAEPAIVDINVNDASPAGQPAAAAGTGMIVTSSGEVLTNNHVVDGATSIKITIAHHSGTYTAKVIGVDPTQDVALLQIENPPANLPYLSLGNSSTAALGSTVVAIGNALGLGGSPSIATGVVSALGRTITASDQSATSTSETLHNLIQTDAQIAPGDSGGPLLNTKGQVIGMDTAAASDNGQGGTLGFAIPINTVKTIVEQMEKGQASSTVLLGSSPFLGIYEQETGTGAGVSGGGSFSGLPGFGSSSSSGSSTSTAGVPVYAVVGGSPAQKAGLTGGDVITAVDGKATTTFSALQKVVSALKPGDQVTLNYVNSNGTSESATVTLSGLPK